MLNSAIPPKFQIPWANSAGSANVRAIPQASQISLQAGAASLTDGFPPLNFVPVSAGGVPPFGQDMNGILKQVTQWLQWDAAGGAVRYDAAFVSAVGGYPAGATLVSNSGHCVFQSLTDNNASDPNASPIPASWRVLSSVWSGAAWSALGSANAQVVSILPAPSTLSQLGNIPLTVISTGINTGPVTLNIGGSGAVPVTTAGGVALAPGALVTGAPFTVVLSGSSYVMTSETNSYTDTGGGGLTITGSTASGAAIVLHGNGTTTPKKLIRAANGLLQILSDSGSVIANFSDVGDVTASAHLRATNGATGSGDNLAATLLGDFPLSVVSNQNIIQTLPSGFIIQGFSIGNTTGADFINFPVAFPHTSVQVVACEANPVGWVSGTSPSIFGTQQLGASNFALYVTGFHGGVWALQGGVGTRVIAIGY